MNEERATKILRDTITAMVYALAWDIVKERNPDSILPSDQMLKVQQTLMTEVRRYASDAASGRI